MFPTLVIPLIAAMVFHFDAHPICIDSTAPMANQDQFSTCSAWNGLKTCVSPSEEADKVKMPQFQSEPPQACRNLLQSTSCAVVDGWSGHLFRAEGPTNVLDYPKLCPDFCSQLYSQCSTVIMSQSPFVGGENTFKTMAQVYGSSAAFCREFASSEYCFKGVPFTVPPPQPFTPGFSLCIEKVAQGGEDKVSFQPVPGHPNLLLGGDLSGIARIYSVNNNQTGTQFQVKSILINLVDRINYGGEQGLLGMAMHKQFFTNGRFYVSFSCKLRGYPECEEGDSIVEEFRVLNPSNPNALQANLNTRRRIFRITQPYPNHNGGQLLFSPDPNDPHLYFMLGDGGSGGDPGNRAQPLTTFYGKVLRIDVNANFNSGGLGAVPSDNPFVNVADAKGLIWANGLRNPWRCSFDRETYLLYCGDVGQDIMEEIDIITKGANYGWRKYEGTRFYDEGTELLGSGVHTPPIIAYLHTEASNAGYASVTGGYVVRGGKNPNLIGKYIFADIAGPTFLAQESPVGSGQWKHSKVGLICASTSPFPCDRGAILSFGEMLTGDIIFGDDDGNIFRFIEPVRCLNCRSLSQRQCRLRPDCRVNRRTRRCQPK